MLKRSILTISPVILIGLLAGCATKQTWVPELEQAQQTFSAISQDPVVVGLAKEDLDLAERRLRSAEDAAATFRKPQSIAHKARLAELQTLTAQQRARALSANHSVQLALGQEPLLAQEKIAAATVAPTLTAPEPSMAAASTGSNPDIQAQLTALSQQLANLQAQLAGTQMSGNEVIPSGYGRTDARNALIELPATASTRAVVLPKASVEQKNQLQQMPAMTGIQSSHSGGSYIEQQIHHKLRAMNAKPNARGMSLMLGERYFDGGTDRLMHQRAARHLDNVAAVLKQNPGLGLTIEGHTDDELTASGGRDLSVNRAVAVKSALVVRGIDAARISTQGFGFSRPVADNTTALGRLQNRRVELVFPVAPVGG